MPQDRRYRIALACIAISAFVIVLLATRWGIATSADSARYIRSARNALGLAAQVQSPIEAPAEQAHYPPGYSTLLVLASLAGSDPLISARWVQAILMALNVVLAAEIVRRATCCITAAIGIALWAAVAPANVFVHTWALSEPLFVLLMMLCVAFTLAYLDRPRVTVLLAAALFAGLGMLVRYAGVSIVPAEAAAILLLNPQRVVRRRFVDAAIFVAVACLLPGLWSLRNQLVLGSATNRVIAFHPITLGHISDAASTFCGWIFTTDKQNSVLRLIALVIVTATVAAGAWLALRRRDTAGRAAGVIVLIVLCTALTLAWSISFVDAHTPVDLRILAPIHTLWIVLVGLLLALPPRNIRVAGYAIVLIAVVTSAVRSSADVKTAYHDGAGFAHDIWRNSPTIAAMRQLPSELIIYTNAPGAAYLLTGKPVIITIPAPTSGSSLLPNPEYEESMQRIADDVRAGRAVVVWLRNYGKRRTNYPSVGAIQQKLNLQMRSQFADGAIFDAIAPSTNATSTSAPSTTPAAELLGSRSPSQ
jgi:hypothetical protein